MKVFIILGSLILIGFVAVQVFALKSQKGIETYPYVVIQKYEQFEIRNYEASLFTSVQLANQGYKDTSGKGFSILASYIFGGNERNEKIAMTSPVTMSLEDTMTVMFMVPRAKSKEMLPKPKQPQIAFKEEPAKTVAAIRFDGWANDKKIEKYKKKLKTALDQEGITYTNRFQFFGYNAPYEVFNRRNEVIVELESIP